MSGCRDYKSARTVRFIPSVPTARRPCFCTLLRGPAIASRSRGSGGSGACVGGRRAAGGQLCFTLCCLLLLVLLLLLRVLRLMRLRLQSILLCCHLLTARWCFCASACALLLLSLLLLLLLPWLRSLVRRDSSACAGAGGTLRCAGGVLPFPALLLLPLLGVRRRRQRLVPRHGRRRRRLCFHCLLFSVHRRRRARLDSSVLWPRQTCISLTCPYTIVSTSSAEILLA